MAIADVITGGFGTFSSVNLVPTRGFTIGAAAAVITPTGLDYSITDSRPHYSITDSRPHYKVDDNRLFVKAIKHAN